MSINEIIEGLLKDIAPVAQDEYTGNSKKYILYIYETESPMIKADDEVLIDKVSLQIQFICPKSFNYISTKKIIRNRLESAGFSKIEVRTILSDAIKGTEKQRQIIFSVEYAESR